MLNSGKKIRNINFTWFFPKNNILILNLEETNLAG
jgi:hypothetical protein